MHTYATESYTTDAFWEAVRGRLARAEIDPENLWGNAKLAKTNFHHSWIHAFEMAFSNADFLTACLARDGADVPRPFILRFHKAAERATEQDADNWATSFAEAAAYVYECCRDSLVFPDQCSVDRIAGRLSLRLQGEPFAEVAPMVATAARRESDVDRARSTLVGFRDADDPIAELCKRLSRWPGMERLQADESTSNVLWGYHLPVPAEWLWTARRMLASAGRPSDLSSAQKFIAALFGAESFNHAIHGRASVIASLAGPWKVGFSDWDSHESTTFHLDPYTGLSTFVELVRSRADDWSRQILVANRGSTLASLALILQSGEHTFDYIPDSIMLSQMTCVWPEESGSVAAVETALRDESGQLMKDLFMVDLAGEARIEELISTLPVKSIGATESWRFVYRPDKRYVGALHVSAIGNVTSEAYVPTYKGTLVYDEGMAAWVLFSDNNYTRPVAAMRSLPPSLVAKVQALLDRAPGPYRGLRDEERREVKRLLAETEGVNL